LRFAIGFLMIALLGGLFWWGLRSGSAANGRPVPTSALVKSEKPAPDFSMPTLEPYLLEWGETLTLSQFVGDKPIILNFWASWCLPCRREAPLFERYWQQYKDRVLFLGVNFQDKPIDADAFIKEFSMTFPSGSDPKAKIGIDYGIFGLPETFIISKEGKVVAKQVGEISEAQLKGYLSQVLGTP
jgi:cytochrome c biogenesis protein CcmG, thiol:disulfide interchange protein DsbE